MFTYSAICDVPEETLLQVTALLRGHRREMGTRKGRRAGSERTQAKLVLRWFRDDAPIRARRRGGSADLHQLPIPARGDRRDRRTGPLTCTECSNRRSGKAGRT